MLQENNKNTNQSIDISSTLWVEPNFSIEFVLEFRIRTQPETVLEDILCIA